MILTPNLGFKSVRGKSKQEPPAPSFDPDYQAVLNAVTANGDTLPSESIQEAHNLQLIDLKNQGKWSQLDSYAVFEGDSPVQYKLMDWKRLIKMTAIGGLTWNINGVQGNGVDGYIDTNYNLGTDSQNYTVSEASYGIGVFNGTGTGILIGSRESGGSDYHTLIGKITSGSDLFFRMNGKSDQGNITKADLTGDNLFSVSGGRRYYDLDGINQHTGAPGTGGMGIENRNVYLLAANTGGSPAYFSDMGLTHFYAGSSLI